MPFDDNFNLSEPGYEKMSIYRKGQEIFDLVKCITDLFPDENDQLQMIKGQMIEDAMYLVSKVASAEGADLYDIRMENAAIIRKAARDLMVSYHALELFGFEHAEYFLMVRDLIEEYRLLFIDWVASFDKWNYSIDRWGLFNPPGIGPFDKDPDDDISYDNKFNDEL